MAQVIYSQRAFDDLDRLADFLLTNGPEAASQTVELIIEAISMLERHPMIGRALDAVPLRELVISRGRTGYVALYSVEPEHDAVLVLAIRHQREAGYDHDT